MKNKIFLGIFLIWSVLWVSFIERGLFRKGYFYDYKELLIRSPEGRRSYVTGDRFYDFIVFCNSKLPEGESYRWMGLEDGSHAKRRATYYLYPHLEKEGARFILVYDKPYKGDDYAVFAALDKARYILKRR